MAEFCLYVTRDLDEALALATQDYAERPNEHAGQLLTAVLAARGQADGARLLTEQIDAERVAAIARLQDTHLIDCLSKP